MLAEVEEMRSEFQSVEEELGAGDQERGERRLINEATEANDAYVQTSSPGEHGLRPC